MTSELLLQLAIATLAVATTVLLHLVGLGALLKLMRVHKQRFSTARARVDQIVILLGVAFGLFTLHTAEIWIYGALFWLLPTGLDLEEALYFSTATYATIGYGDVTLPRAWRMLGAIEGANGVILLGWSTAFFVSVVARMRALDHDFLGKQDETDV